MQSITTSPLRPKRWIALAPGIAAIALAGTSLSACSSKGESATGAIAVNATDTTCEVARDTAPAGTIEFTIANKGTKVNEFYVYAEGDRIMGEVENISPGLTRTFHVQVPDAGKYQTACKPGMSGDGIRSEFTVTGATAPPRTEDALLTQATTEYTRYANSQAEAFLTETEKFVDLVKKGDVEGAKALYPTARSYWERIEPVAESFGDLDPKIDGRADVVADGMKFTGFHRLEQDLWQKGLQPDTNEIADTLLTDVKTLVSKVKTVKLNPLQLSNGAKALLDEIATGKITGEEERYSHTDLYDFEANFEGSKTALAALRPFLTKADPNLVTEIDKRTKALDEVLKKHAEGDGWVSYDKVNEADRKELSNALDALTAEVAKVSAVVAKAV